MASINELKEIMSEIGIDNDTLNSIDPDKALSLQGLDSLDFPAFASAVEDRYGISISDRDALRLKTINDFIRFIGTQA